MVRLILAAVAVALFATAAPASDKKKAAAIDTEKAFKQLDGDSNGKLTLEEFKNLGSAITLPKKAASPDYDALFKKLDKDGDKTLSADEFKKLPDVMAASTMAKKKKKAK